MIVIEFDISSVWWSCMLATTSFICFSLWQNWRLYFTILLMYNCCLSYCNYVALCYVIPN